MYCPGCGKEIKEDTAFCSSCGYQLKNMASPSGQPSGTGENSVFNNNQQTAPKKKGKKGVVIAVIVIALVAIIIAVCVLASKPDAEEYVNMVKDGTSEAYPNLSYGTVFEDFFTDPAWRYFESSDDRDIVEFTGKCTYNEEAEEVLIQFDLDSSEGRFEAVYLEMNGEAQDQDMMYTVINTVFYRFGMGDGELGSYDYLLEDSENTDSADDSSDDAENVDSTDTTSDDIDNTDETIDSTTVTDIDYYAVYYDMVGEIMNCYGEYSQYTLYDMDQDGVKELIISAGSCDADWTNEVYTVDENGACYYMGEFYSAVTLYVAEDGNGIYAVSGNMGVQNIDQITKSGKQITVTNISNGELGADEEYYSNDNLIPFSYVTDISILQ